MYKIILPFENNNKIYYFINKHQVIKEIYNDYKNILNINNTKIVIKDINTGNKYSYIIIKNIEN